MKTLEQRVAALLLAEKPEVTFLTDEEYYAARVTTLRPHELLAYQSKALDAMLSEAITAAMVQTLPTLRPLIENLCAEYLKAAAVIQKQPRRRRLRRYRESDGR